jgi:hypothetical protein
MISNLPKPIWAPDVLAVITILVVLFVTLHSLPVWGQELGPVAKACKALQPRLEPDAARQWGKALRDVDAEVGIGDPFLLAALVMRESSFNPRVADGTVRGALGEVGPLQVHGVAFRFAPRECRGKLGNARCLLRTGARFLAYRFKRCPGSMWAKVASYGMRRCASEKAARADTATRRAWAFYQRIRPGKMWD